MAPQEELIEKKEYFTELLRLYRLNGSQLQTEWAEKKLDQIEQKLNNS